MTKSLVTALGVVGLIVGCATVDVQLMYPMTADVPVIGSAVSRAITWENQTGEPGAGGEEGGGRKGSPKIPNIAAGQTETLMDVKGAGMIRHIWVTVSKRKPQHLRNFILRMYWDGEEAPSVEVPFGDFFGTAHGQSPALTSAWTTATLGRGYNCFFPMPFGNGARITLENAMEEGSGSVYFQIDYDVHESMPENVGRLHAQFRRQNPTVLKEDYVIVDNVCGPGMYVGTVIGVRALGPNWWGEGEVKCYMDGDTDYPTICGTGTEDYFCAAWGMDLYQTPYHGCTLNLKNDFFKDPLVSMYRWHVKDPIRFRESLKVTIQQIGWREGGLYERSDDWCSVAYWYQVEPHNPFPELPDRAARTAGIVEPAKPKKEG